MKYSRSLQYCLLFFLIMFVLSCSKNSITEQKQFTVLDSDQSGIAFENTLRFIEDFNIYTYRNFYNGGGVGIGDINNDGFMDIYFTANLLPNKLYLNNGDLTFTDITEKAGVGGSKAWSTGVSMADVNGDGWIDIYVCNSGDVEGDNKQNELFINQGDGTFIEEAEKYGLADQGYSTHAAFFDYDKDGDLDAYLLNNSFQAIGSFNLRKNERPVRNQEGGDKLFRNDDGRFADVSEQAGIYGSVIGFGLGVTVGDIDQDGWQDMYISNDFFERDYIYMNNGDGTFTEDLVNQMKSISGASMGADMADINNDGYPDIFVTEMLPEPHDRLKTKTTFENWDKYQYNLENGYYHQFTRNMLQLNNGNNTFSEIGRLSGVEATDWSWGALICDFDNDGYRDLFVANGIYKDLTDQDYINYISTEEMAKSVITAEGVDFQTLTDVIPSNKIPNYIFKNTGDLNFENMTEQWGLERLSHSNGSAYVDLDNDGDMDLVINNVNEVATVYLNNSEVVNENHNYLKIELKGLENNTQAIGSKVSVYSKDEKWVAEQMPVRGFESSVDPRLNFGVSDHSVIDSVTVTWPNGLTSVLTDVAVNQTITMEMEVGENIPSSEITDNQKRLFSDITDQSGLNFVHKENDFVDFDRDRLLYHMLSAEGPAMCSGDLNGDGYTDIYVGGASEQQGAIFWGNPKGVFEKARMNVFANEALSEDVDCTCFDADGDGDLDLYVASGGNEFPNSSSALIDRLYINNGSGSFTKSNQILPSFQFTNSSVVSPNDVDNDGDVDLFIGVRAQPFLVGVPADSYLLLNDGSGVYTDAKSSNAPGLEKIGMVTDATWSDIDGDDDQDLIVIGEWMDIKVFQNTDGNLKEIGSQLGLDSTSGWWNSIEVADIDQDGDEDFILGNHGLNSRFKASKKAPVTMYVNDFDQNGSAEAIICRHFGEVSYPLCLKHDLIAQIPQLKKKYVQYEAFKDETINDIFDQEQIASSVISRVYNLESSILLNEGEKGLHLIPLPEEAQLSPVFASVTEDFDNDGIVDLLLGGNFYYTKPEVGRYDASYGVYLKGKGNGEFEFVPNKETGLTIEDQVREMLLSTIDNKKLLVVARNDSSMKVFQL